MGHFRPKIIVCPQSSGCTLRIFNILHNERGQEAYEAYISDFCKKDHVEGKWVIVGPKMLCPQNSGSALKDLFIILHNERGEEGNEN